MPRLLRRGFTSVPPPLDPPLRVGLVCFFFFDASASFSLKMFFFEWGEGKHIMFFFLIHLKWTTDCFFFFEGPP